MPLDAIVLTGPPAFTPLCSLAIVVDSAICADRIATQSSQIGCSLLLVDLSAVT